jgi:hypothetical protein
MVAAGETEIAEVLRHRRRPDPVPPCGGCRQKLSEFAGPDVPVTMATLDGRTLTMTMDELLPLAFKSSRMRRAMTSTARLIAGLRDGRAPAADALAGFARGLADGSVTDAQAGAFAMAVCLRGLGRGGARGADRSDARFGPGDEMGSARSGCGQALDRRYRRRGVAAAGPGAGGLRGLCADGFGPRDWVTRAARSTSWRRSRAIAPASGRKSSARWSQGRGRPSSRPATTSRPQTVDSTRSAM